MTGGRTIELASAYLSLPIGAGLVPRSSSFFCDLQEPACGRQRELVEKEDSGRDGLLSFVWQQTINYSSKPRAFGLGLERYSVRGPRAGIGPRVGATKFVD